MVNKDRLVQLFFDLVKINSESGEEANLCRFLNKKLIQLGLETEVDKKGNLIAILPGDKSKPILLFSAHMDTVKPGKNIVPILQDGVIESDTDTILGADDKSGIAEILEMLEVINEKNIQVPTLKFVFTVEEEVGLKGARNLKKIIADYGFVLDTGGKIGTVTNRAPSHHTFLAEIKGKAAHAGFDPEKGVNAIVVVSKAIAKMSLGKIDKDTVANVGYIQGGTATNIVPETVVIKGEARSHNLKKLEKTVSEMEQILANECSNLGAKLIFNRDREYINFEIPSTAPVISVCQKAAELNEINLEINSSNAGSDANFFNTMGIPTVVLSTGMEKVHTNNEQIKVENMVKATEFILAIVN